VLLGIWDIFKSNGIEFPYPQRDVHIKSAPYQPNAKVIDELAPSLKE